MWSPEIKKLIIETRDNPKQLKEFVSVEPKQKLEVNTRNKKKKGQGKQSQKRTSETPLQEINLFELLAKKYVESRETAPKNFIYCDLLRDVVMEKKMNYFVIEFRDQCDTCSIKVKNGTTKELFDYCNPTLSEASNFLSAIDNEEIPCEIFDLLLTCPITLLYEYYSICEVRILPKESNQEKPFFSRFILLKPIMPMAFAYPRADKNKKITKEELSNETQLYLAFAAPLYLGLYPNIAELTFYLNTYRAPFAKESLRKSVTVQRVEYNPKNETISFETLEEESRRITQSLKDPSFLLSAKDTSWLVKRYEKQCSPLMQFVKNELGRRNISKLHETSSEIRSYEQFLLLYTDKKNKKEEEKEYGKLMSVISDKNDAFYLFVKDIAMSILPSTITMIRFPNRESIDEHIALLYQNLFTSHDYKQRLMMRNTVSEEVKSIETIGPKAYCEILEPEEENPADSERMEIVKNCSDNALSNLDILNIIINKYVQALIIEDTKKIPLNWIYDPLIDAKKYASTGEAELGTAFSKDLKYKNEEILVPCFEQKNDHAAIENPQVVNSHENILPESVQAVTISDRKSPEKSIWTDDALNKNTQNTHTYDDDEMSSISTESPQSEESDLNVLNENMEVDDVPASADHYVSQLGYQTLPPDKQMNIECSDPTENMSSGDSSRFTAPSICDPSGSIERFGRNCNMCPILRQCKADMRAGSCNCVFSYDNYPSVTAENRSIAVDHPTLEEMMRDFEARVFQI